MRRSVTVRRVRHHVLLLLLAAATSCCVPADGQEPRPMTFTEQLDATGVHNMTPREQRLLYEADYPGLQDWKQWRIKELHPDSTVIACKPGGVGSVGSSPVWTSISAFVWRLTSSATAAFTMPNAVRCNGVSTNKSRIRCQSIPMTSRKCNTNINTNLQVAASPTGPIGYDRWWPY